MARNNFLLENVTVTGLADKGLSVGKDPEGKVVFIEGAVPGDVLDVRVLRKRKGYYQGLPQRFLILSDARQNPACRHFEDCGGCKWQHFRYENQLIEKERIVHDAFRRIAKVTIQEIRPILAAPQTFHYRNKMEFSFSNQRWRTKSELEAGSQKGENALGLHPPRFFNKVVDIEECLLMDPLADEIRNFVRSYAIDRQLSFYDSNKHQGFLRNMILRNSTLDQWMLVMSFGHEDIEAREDLLIAIKKAFPKINSLHYVINSKQNDTLYDQEILLASGDPYIEEKLGELLYKIRPKSFFQTNSQQAKQLYDIVKEFATLDKNQVVYDLYTGTGSIALYLAKDCRVMVGVEEVSDAIDDAKDNAAINQVENAHFYVGDVRHVFSDELIAQHGVPDVVITDPPRAGMHEKVIESILDADPGQIIYISCNPATQARDIHLLADRYQVEKIQPVDMFPHTNHIENVALLMRKS
ncbi:MAG: 23S rRNA (uracil(1939)-C(5))-methyltransferase RlmD [Saprospiraceae bacterium]|nr:23S rRNA (uracil(1939)-C(5))-methyltransferase RlmD [Saprospiraceae bacterium]